MNCSRIVQNMLSSCTKKFKNSGEKKQKCQTSNFTILITSFNWNLTLSNNPWVKFQSGQMEHLLDKLQQF